jgi:hypothetical protein
MFEAFKKIGQFLDQLQTTRHELGKLDDPGSCVGAWSIPRSIAQNGKTAVSMYMATIVGGEEGRRLSAWLKQADWPMFLFLPANPMQKATYSYQLEVNTDGHVALLQKQSSLIVT